MSEQPKLAGAAVTLERTAAGDFLAVAGGFATCVPIAEANAVAAEQAQQGDQVRYYALAEVLR